MLNKITDDLPIFLKTLSAYSSGVMLTILGHEYSHGEILRRLDEPHSYKISLGQGKICYGGFEASPETFAHLYINGRRFEKELRDDVRKDQIMNGINYANSTLLAVSIQSKYKCIADMESDPFNDFHKYLDISKIHGLKTMVCLSFIDPLSLFSIFNTTSAFLNNDVRYSINYMPSVDYCLYPKVATYELGFATKLNNSYFRITTEYGSNKYGGSLEMEDICKINNITLSGKIHWVRDTIGQICPMVEYKNFLVGAIYSFEKLSLEKDIELYIGVKF